MTEGTLTWACADAREPQDIPRMASALAEKARKRQSVFATREEFAGHLLAARAFERLQPGAAELIAHTTLRPADGGNGYQLCCPTAYEARIFDQLYDSAVAADIQKLRCPTKTARTRVGDHAPGGSRAG